MKEMTIISPFEIQAYRKSPWICKHLEYWDKREDRDARLAELKIELEKLGMKWDLHGRTDMTVMGVRDTENINKKKTIGEIVKLLLDDSYWDIKDGGDV